MVACSGDAAALTMAAALLRESASLYHTLGAVAADAGLRQRAAQRGALREGLCSQLNSYASVLMVPGTLEPECATSAEYLAILKCLAAGEIASAERRLESFDGKIAGSIALYLAGPALSADTASILGLVAPLLFLATTQQDEEPTRRSGHQ